MSAKTMKVGYRLVRNGTSTADRAQYLGIAVPIGPPAFLLGWWRVFGSWWESVCE